jgi:hypothetical protein
MVIALQPGVLRGAIRVVGGETDGLGPKWRHAYRRWDRPSEEAQHV